MIHLERVDLPHGLHALAYRDARGNVVIYVSQTLDAAYQRAAVVAAIRASRRAGWRAGLPSAGVALLLGIRAAAGNAARALRARPLAWGAAAATAVLGASVAAVFITATPNHQAPPESAGRQAPHYVLPRPQPGQRPAHASHPTQARRAPTASPAPGRLTGYGQPSPSPAPTGGSSPAPAASSPAPPTPTPTPTEPTPTPTPTHSPPPSGICVDLLGLRVCLR
jgi:hypothetical protein